MGKRCSYCRYIAPVGPSGYERTCPKCDRSYDATSQETGNVPVNEAPRTIRLAPLVRPKTAPIPPTLAEATPPPPAPPFTQRSTNLGIAGATAIILGTFLPAVHVPVMGDISLFNGVFGWLAVAIGIGGLWGSLTARRAVMMACALLALITVGVAYMNVAVAMAKFHNDLATIAKDGGLTGSLIGLAGSGTRLGYAWGVLALGMGLLFAGGVSTRK